MHIIIYLQQIIVLPSNKKKKKSVEINGDLKIFVSEFQKRKKKPTTKTFALKMQNTLHERNYISTQGC